MPYRADAELPVGMTVEDFRQLGGLDGVKVIDLGTTGPDHGGAMLQLVGGNRGQVTSTLTRAGLNASQFTITEFTMT